MSLEHVEYLEAAIARLDGRVNELMAPFAWARDRLDTITGVGQKAAESIIAEIGVDMSVFPTAGHLCSWAGQCPANNITGGKRRSTKTNRGNRWLGDPQPVRLVRGPQPRNLPVIAVLASGPTDRQEESAVAVRHSILAICSYLLSENCDYNDFGGDYFTQRDTDRTRQRAIAHLQALGYQVTLEPTAA